MANLFPGGSSAFYSMPQGTSNQTGYYGNVPPAAMGSPPEYAPSVSAGAGTTGTLGATNVPGASTTAWPAATGGYMKAVGKILTGSGASTPASATPPLPSPPAAVMPTPGTGVLSGPGYGESWEQQHGNDLTTPSNSQSLYDEGINATNPYYQHAMDMTNQGINLAEAARGEGNSGAALAEIGTADSTLAGAQALSQQTLAGQADTSDVSRFTAGSSAALGAENQTNNRVSGAAAAYTNLSTSQANMVDNFYQMAESGQLTAGMASIEAQLAASGVDAQTAQAIVNDLSTVAAAGIKAGSK